MDLKREKKRPNKGIIFQPKINSFKTLALEYIELNKRAITANHAIAEEKAVDYIAGIFIENKDSQKNHNEKGQQGYGGKNVHVWLPHI